MENNTAMQNQQQRVRYDENNYQAGEGGGFTTDLNSVKKWCSNDSTYINDQSPDHKRSPP